MRRVRAVYVTQYGYYWRLTPAQWRSLLVELAAGRGYDLDEVGARALRGRPRHVISPRGMGPDSTDPERPLYQPLDWSAEHAAFELAQLDAEGGVTKITPPGLVPRAWHLIHLRQQVQRRR